MIELNKIYHGSSLDVLKTFPNDFIDCCITSPPYWCLRDYGVKGQLGLEKTPEEFITKLADIFDEVKRIMKPTGTFWVNIGDSYANNGSGGYGKTVGRDKSTLQGKMPPIGTMITTKKIPLLLKPKDLVGIPWMLAFELRRRGWYLRQEIIWNKPNPMPESVTDRCTKSHEQIFLFSKSKKYYFDVEAIKTTVKSEHKNINGAPGQPKHSMNQPRLNKKFRPNGIVRDRLLDYDSKEKKLRPNTSRGEFEKESYIPEPSGKANKRSVWTVPTQSFKEAHFATFPEKLIEPCVLAGTSEHGCCSECGKPYERIVEKETAFQSGSGKAKIPMGWHQSGSLRHASKDVRINSGKNVDSIQSNSGEYDIRMGPVNSSKTTGWKSTCKCKSKIKPPIVLDPFMGAGTTAMLSKKKMRDYIGIELNKKYISIAEKRLYKELGFFQ